MVYCLERKFWFFVIVVVWDGWEQKFKGFLREIIYYKILLWSFTGEVWSDSHNISWDKQLIRYTSQPLNNKMKIQEKKWKKNVSCKSKEHIILNILYRTCDI